MRRAGIPPATLHVGAFAAAFDRYAIAPLLVPIAHEFGASLAEATAAASVYFLCNAVAQLAFGPAADRFGRRRMLRLAYAGAAGGATASALAPTLPALLAARGATGAMTAGIVAVSLVHVGDRFTAAARQRALADLMGAAALAMALATLLAGIAADALSWRLSFAVLALAGAPLALSIRGADPARGGGTRFRTTAARVLRDRWAVALMVLGACQGAAFQGGVTFLAPALQSAGASAAAAGLALTAFGAVALVVSRSARPLFRRLSPAALMAAGGLALATGYCVAGLGHGFAAVIVAAGLCGVASPTLHATLQAWMLDTVPAARGTAAALFGAGLLGGAAASTALLGRLAADERYGALFACTAALAVAVTIAAAVGRAAFDRGRAQRAAGTRPRAST